VIKGVFVPKYKKITIKWADHFIEYGDHDVEDVKKTVKKPFAGEYTGYLVAESKQMMAISSNIWEDGSVSDVMYIMKRAIIK